MKPRDTRPLALSCGRIADRLVDRDGKADAARTRADRRVDADHLAARVDQRPAAVAEIDRGVGLDVVVEARIEQLAADEADHADGHRVLVAERVADRADPLADPQLVGIAERRLRQVRRAGNPAAARRRSPDRRRRLRRGTRGRRRASRVIRLGDSMTWLFVRMKPSRSMMKPLPDPCRAVDGRADRRRPVVPATPRVALRVARRRRVRRGVDVDDRRVDPLGDVGKVDQPRLATAGRRAVARTEPGRGRRRRHDRRGRQTARPDQADEKRHGAEARVRTVKRFESNPVAVGRSSFSIISLRNSSSVSDRHPQFLAPSRACCPRRPRRPDSSSSWLTDPATFPPSRSMAAAASSRRHRRERSGEHEGLARSGPARRDSGARLLRLAMLTPAAASLRPARGCAARRRTRGPTRRRPGRYRARLCSASTGASRIAASVRR